MLYDPEGNSGAVSLHAPLGVIQTQAARNAYRSFVANPKQNEALLAEVVTQASSIIDVDAILTKRVKSGTAAPIFDAVLCGLARRDNAIDLYVPKTIVNYYPDIANAIDQEARERLLKISLEQALLENEMAQSHFGPQIAGLYREVLCLKPSERLEKKLIEGLGDLAKDDWVAAVKGQNEIIPLIQDLVAKKTSLRIGYVLRDALDDFADGLLSGSAPEHISPEACSALFFALTPEQQTLFSRDICTKVIRADSPTTNLLSLFADALCDWKILLEQADDLVREGFGKILERGVVEEYTWMKKVLEECPEALAKCHPETRQDFFDRLAEFDPVELKEQSVNLLSEIKTICKISTGKRKK